MDDHTSGQLKGTAVDIYEAFFVPALFGQFASKVVETLRLHPKDRVLDVACGTGIVAGICAINVAHWGRFQGGRPE